MDANIVSPFLLRPLRTLQEFLRMRGRETEVSVPPSDVAACSSEREPEPNNPSAQP